METLQVQSDPTRSSTQGSNSESSVLQDSQVANFSQPDAAGNPRMATFIERLVAYLVDGFILRVIIVVISVFFSSISTLLDVSSSSAVPFIKTSFSIFSITTSLVMSLVYFGFFYTRYGQSPGKMLMKIKVVDTVSYKYVTWAQVIIRQVVSFFSRLVFLLGYLWYFMSDKRQTWHDVAAKTYVVKTDAKGNLLMDGPQTYKSEPVKTFLPCGCFGLFFLAMVISFAFGTAAIVSRLNNSDTSKNGSLGSDLNLNFSGKDKNAQSDGIQNQVDKFLEGATGAGGSEQIIKVKDSEKRMNAILLVNTILRYYLNNSKYPWDVVPGSVSPNRVGKQGQVVSGQSWITKGSNSLAGSGELKGYKSFDGLYIWVNDKGSPIVCFVPQSKSAKTEAKHNALGMKVGTGGSYLCFPE